jgi:hypothetical protein
MNLFALLFIANLLSVRMIRSLMSIIQSLIFAIHFGGLAQLARAFAWHAKGHRFDSGNLHNEIRLAESASLSFFDALSTESLPGICRIKTTNHIFANPPKNKK